MLGLFMDRFGGGPWSPSCSNDHRDQVRQGPWSPRCSNDQRVQALAGAPGAPDAPVTIVTKFAEATGRTMVDEGLARHLEQEFGWICSEAHLDECMRTIAAMIGHGKWDLFQLKHVFWTILWELPICLEQRKLLTLKYFRLVAAAFKLYQGGEPGDLGTRACPTERKRQVKLGVAFIRKGTDAILQELPKYRVSVLSSKKLIVTSHKIPSRRRERKGIAK